MNSKRIKLINKSLNGELTLRSVAKKIVKALEDHTNLSTSNIDEFIIHRLHAEAQTVTMKSCTIADIVDSINKLGDQSK